MYHVNYEIAPLTETTWEEVDWGAVGQFVWTIQCQIYGQSKEGNRVEVIDLQNLLIGSSQARLLAVRKVTQDNRGKRTAGVDGLKSLTPKARLLLAKHLALDNSCSPVRRVKVPKPGKTEMRNLGIPTMSDRAKQALATLALEPEHEAKFEANSYGFRPGRNAQDAMQALRTGLRSNPKYVFEADIEKCFDTIMHNFLYGQLTTNSIIQSQVLAWLKGGVVDVTGELLRTEEGTPQGGIISPLLANIALDGIEKLLEDQFNSRRGKPGWTKLYNAGKPTFARYADDFVICHPDLTFLKECIDATKIFMETRGLKLSVEKSRICVTNKKYLDSNPDYKEGFDFLGFNYRLYNSKARGTMSSRRIQKPYVLLITPSLKNIKKHYQELKRTVWANKGATQANLIKKLNPKILGWASYYTHVNSSEVFSKMDHKLWWLTFNWSRKRHPKKGTQWVIDRYFHRYKNVTHRFLTLWHNRPAHILNAYSSTSIKQYIKCKGTYSPFGFPEAPIKDLFKRNTLSYKLHVKQKGLCKVCGNILLPQEPIEKHHLLPKGIKERNNLKHIWLIHGSCHDQVHSTEGFTVNPKDD